MVPGFQPVQEIYKVFILPFQIQLINLWDFHMDFIQVLQIVAYRKGRPFHRIRRTIGLDFIFQIFGWQRNNVIRLAVLDVIIFCTPCTVSNRSPPFLYAIHSIPCCFTNSYHKIQPKTGFFLRKPKHYQQAVYPLAAPSGSSSFSVGFSIPSKPKLTATA